MLMTQLAAILSTLVLAKCLEIGLREETILQVPCRKSKSNIIIIKKLFVAICFYSSDNLLPTTLTLILVSLWSVESFART